jgi:metallo-beta-lactamase class B
VNQLTRASCHLLAVSLLAAALSACQTMPSEATVAAHVAAATNAAGSDLAALMFLCQPAPATRLAQELIDKAVAAQIARPAPPPGQAFDNLFFVGSAWVSAWALTTSEGIILIDALNNQAEASTLIEGGMRKLGMDPAQIKYVIVTHAHGDHYGGATHLVDRYKPRVVMSELDWKMTETQLELTTPVWGPPPKRDIAVTDGDKITLGDTTVTVHLTPGHTRGTVTLTFEVKSANNTHRVMLWGGTAFNFGNDIPRMNSYIDSTERMMKIVQEQQIDVLLSNHSYFDGSLTKLDALRKQPGAEPNPFVMETSAVTRALTAMNECARAQRDRFLLQR